MSRVTQLHSPVSKKIELFFHCGKCLDQGTDRDLEIGWTPMGLHVWCLVHDCNVISH